MQGVTQELIQDRRPRGNDNDGSIRIPETPNYAVSVAVTHAVYGRTFRSVKLAPVSHEVTEVVSPRESEF